MTHKAIRGLVSSLPAGTIQSYGVPANKAREAKAKPQPAVVAIAQKALKAAEAAAAKKAPAKKKAGAKKGKR